MSTNTGGPAFPRTRSADPENYHKPEVYEAQEGMSLRDYFAAKAISSILAMPEGGIQSHHPDDHIDNSSATRVAAMWAEQAYQIADAMVAERAK